jgi:photosystem II stability/assembly factor-like uncharacterized protein
MAKTRARPGHASGRGPRAKEGPRRGARQRKRSWLWLGALAAVGLALAVAFWPRGEKGSASTPFVGGDLHSLALDPDGIRLYVGGHEAVAVSIDGGRSWTSIPTLDGADAMGWGFVGDRVFVGGHPGLHISEDGAKTFRKRNQGLPATDIHALGAGQGLVYAASPEAGVFASADGGRSWQPRSTNAGQAFMGRILVDPADPEHLWATDMRAGVVESADGGRSWRTLGGGVGAMWLSSDPANAAHLIASGPDRVTETLDGGKSWHRIEVPQGTWVVEMSRTDSHRVLFAAIHEESQAILRISRDGGRSWSAP